MSEKRLIDANKLFDFIQKEKAWKQGTSRQPRYDKGKYDAYYEMLEIIKKQPTIDAEPVVRCKDCIYWENRKIMMPNGERRDYGPQDEFYVDIKVGINVSCHCTKHGFENESGSWFWANENDFCSRGKRKATP